MDFEVSYSSPHKVFLSKSKREELGITPGDPVELEFDELENELVGKCEDLETLSENKESYALISILHYCLDELQEFHDGLFSKFESTDVSSNTGINRSIQTHSEFEDYVNYVRHINSSRLSDSDIVIGCGLVDLITDDEFEDFIQSPYSQHNIATVSMGIKNELGNLSHVTRYDSEILTTEELIFCTYRTELSENISEKLKDYIVDDRYVMPGLNYQYYFADTPVHGPTHTGSIDNESDESTRQVVLVTEDNIKFNSNETYLISTIGTDDLALSKLEGLLNSENLEEFDLSYNLELGENHLLLRIDSVASVIIRTTDDGILVRTAHLPNRIDSNELIDKLISELESEISSEIDVSLHTAHPTNALQSDNWVFDTNSIYRQDPSKNHTSIVDFVLTNSVLLNRNISIPWNVMCEINRHKDSNRSSTVNSSKQGIENLKILKLLDNIGFLNLDIEKPPERIDNSINQASGVTDLSILNSVPEDGVLFTNDEHLLDIAKMMDVEVDRIENVHRLSDRGGDTEQEYWITIKEILDENGPTKPDAVYDQIVDISMGDDAEEQSSVSETIDQRLRNNDLIETVDEDGEELLALSDTVEIIPTFEFINQINQTIIESNGDHLLSENVLEKIRTSIGGLGTAYRPTLVFLIPVQYILKSSEISQINSLETLRHIDNSKFRTIQSGLTTETKMEIDNIIIESAMERECSILCADNEEMRKFRLLDISFCSVRF